MDNNIRQNIHKSQSGEVQLFLAALKKAGYKQRSFHPADEVSHFERYTYLKDGQRIGIVYDIKASILSITSHTDLSAGLMELYKAATKPAEPISMSGKAMPPKIAGTARQRIEGNKPLQRIEGNKPLQRIEGKPQKVADKQEQKASEKAGDNCAVAASVEAKNGFSIKKYPLERLEGVLKRLRTQRGYSVKKQSADSDTLTYTVSDKSSQKVYLRYAAQKKTLQLQGKLTSLFGEVQVLVSEDSDFASAVSSHIEMSGEKSTPSKLHADLKRKIPSAMEFLSDQSKIDLSIALYDFARDSLELSDYSVLLVPPYRGLERFIYDLQTAQGIEVKMIGQAFEKEDGIYVLKSGYRKKINSVIYGEVMTALYTEYFARRNFFAHSDNSVDSRSRMIESRAEARGILDNLLKIIEYNSKKLAEIRFSVKKA